MAAAAFKGTVSFRGISGTPYVEALSFSDVANAFATFDSSGLSFISLPEPVYLVDLAEVTGGTDTTKTNLWVNNKDTGIKWINTTVLNTLNNRIPLPIPIGNPQTRGAVMVQLKQLA
ncbi:MAG: hypothetical protein OS112_03265 [Methanoregula sp.]|nr:MAG: hypothetical protein OS112_03265 [Methanoregula sp.]